LWGKDNDEVFERAAAMGRQDASAFSFGDLDNQAKNESLGEKIEVSPREQPLPVNYYMSSLQPVVMTATFEGTPDAITVRSTSTESSDLSAIYKTIRENQARRKPELEPDGDEERPDPGFRIYFVDPETREKIVVPPYTSPGEFLATRRGKDKLEDQPFASVIPPVNGDNKDYGEKTYDGYQDIQQANARNTRAEELEIMRVARRKNRVGFEKIDPSKIGALRMEDDDQIREERNNMLTK
jgi:hypothetical protein